MRTTAYHCIPLHTTAYHCIPLYTALYHCIPLYTNAYVGAQVRAAIMRSLPNLSEVLVRTQTMCPLLDATAEQPLPRLQFEARVESVLRRLPQVAVCIYVYACMYVYRCATTRVL